MTTMAELQNKLKDLVHRINKLDAALKIDENRKKVKQLHEKTLASNFWDDRQAAESLLREQDRVQKLVTAFETATKEVGDAEEFISIIESNEDPLFAELLEKLSTLEEVIHKLEFQRMFGHEADPNNAILSINSGAGGTEAQDWVAMLMRLYLRWCDLNGFKAAIVDTLPGDEAGYKSAMITVEGSYAYGYLKAERGIHRLVRISPFDANSRRHTSFAAVFVIPEVTQEIDIEIKESDLRIDTYRASGAGGQHVNKTDSAVRITHVPTSIVVQCQNERSQHKNKAMCMKILKSKLYEQELAKREEELDAYHSEKKDIAWGSQIRSYVMHPYRMVKDHRTKVEVGNVDAVMDGDINAFIEAYLLMQDSGE